MIKLLSYVIAALFFLDPAGIALAMADDKPLYSVEIDINDKESLQRGARFFMNYCSGCHSLKYMRYNKMGHALGLTTFDGELDEDLLKNNLIFTEATIYNPIHIAMPPEDAKQWFGMVPPDLSLSARDRGPDWLYTYLKSFYSDNTRPFGANNLLMPDVAMPNVLEPLIGQMVLMKNNSSSSNLVLLRHGAMYQAEFDSALKDLVTFLVYVGEPAKMVRYKMGALVILFLCVLFVFAYRLKKSYWKRIK
ncbi:cytochrome c1 [Legionella worsleiensis]|uniref:Ubiquinol-cytochrome c reductase cytochrome c1 subunit n=1 Tax=Legionella worsleiensis TaxID=45076 RepID=A0A0W1AF75_9GAMM|nr:cytochrome c1 [Legionella worsleiensis]KTD79983.1 ubiquinol-cytochrome c reductase cytochrome c1 subunit [Legionella worsleiensis]STY32454.1 ubiquinol-cytochrome c reductase cytochrome c1 subunit [Legionella worsleiensis]